MKSIKLINLYEFVLVLEGIFVIEILELLKLNIEFFELEISLVVLLNNEFRGFDLNVVVLFNDILESLEVIYGFIYIFNSVEIIYLNIFGVINIYMEEVVIFDLLMNFNINFKNIILDYELDRVYVRFFVIVIKEDEVYIYYLEIINFILYELVFEFIGVFVEEIIIEVEY